MGVEVGTALLIMGAAAEGVKAYGQTKAAKSQNRALDLQAKESRLRYNQEQINNLDILEKTMQAQEAEATTRGISLASQSFGAIQADTVAKAGKIASNIEMEENLFQRGLAIEKKNIKQTLFSNLFGDVAAVGFDFAKYRASVPKTKVG